MNTSLARIGQCIAQAFRIFWTAAWPSARKALLQGAHDEGFEAGLREGRATAPPVTYRTEATITPLRDVPVDPGVYGPAQFDTSTVETDMRTKVASLAALGLLKAPSEEQWRMILSSHPATCIAAGAGSGKSTTLVLRVVFMLEYLGIADHELTIISFTRDSCIELRHALKRVLGLWRASSVSDAWLKARVRTFHSLLRTLATSVLPGREFFENLPKDAQDTVDGDVDNPVTASQLNTRQAAILKSAYVAAFAHDADFRRDVLALLDAELLATPGTALDTAQQQGRAFYLSQLDPPLTAMVNQTWQSHGWPFPGVAATPLPLQPMWSDFTFLANGYDPLLRLPIVLGFAPDLTDAQRATFVSAPTGKAKPEAFGQALASKLRFLKNYSTQKYILLQTTLDVDRYRLAHMFRTASDPGALAPPVFPFKLPGEVMASPIQEAFFTQGSFVESLGFSVPSLIAKFDAPKAIDTTVHFYRALARFWPYFERALEDHQLHSYNQAFLLLKQHAATMQFRSTQLAATRHLLVDEFQDISPLITNWLTAMQRRLVTDNQDKPVSIMAIGDDWQSIYGWRGSAPQLFIDFARVFKVHSALKAGERLMLTANYRSVPDIVRDATRLIAKVKARVEKISDAKPAAQPGDHGVILAEYGDKTWIDPTEAATRLEPFIAAQYASARSMKGAKPEHLIVMTRRRKLRNALLRKFPEPMFPGLRLCTYHQAKGLEADVAILIEDCEPSDAHPFRNLAYRASGLYGNYSYFQATTDEAWRLAYVGVTRGRRRVFWQVPSIANAVAARTFASR